MIFRALRIPKKQAALGIGSFPGHLVSEVIRPDPKTASIRSLQIMTRRSDRNEDKYSQSA